MNLLLADAGQGVALFLALLVLYFLPSMIALGRKVPNPGSIVVINTFLGWTLIGWVVALAMAARSVPPVSGVTPEA